ncbi:MAG: PAS domain-containing protein, partial [Cyanobacteria bacterium J06632_3]
MKLLENELYVVRQSLQTTIEELETSNEEQQASNEELIASNEELQSSNEELQSVNEELHTLNVEYQSKNDQLNELNTDLDNLLQNTQVGVIFLDAELKVRRFTKIVTSIIPLVSSDLGRPFDHISWRIECPDLIALINQVSH